MSKLTLFFLLVIDDGYLSGEDERGGRGGAGPERGGGGLGGSVGLGGGVGLGGRAVTIKDLSKLTLFFLLVFDDGYLSGEDERGEREGGGVDLERGGDDLGGGVGLGGRAVTIKYLSKLTLFFLLIFDGGYLSGEDGRGGRGGAEAAADRDGGGVLNGGGDGGGRGSNNEIFLVYKEEEDSGQDSVSAFLFT